MNKKAIFILILVIIFAICFFIGINYKKENKQNDIIKNDMIFNEIEEEGEVEAIVIDSQEEKTTPNTKLTFKKYYADCDHTLINTTDIPEVMVNLTENEIKEKYSNWEVEDFSKEEVVFTKELKSFCGEHYLLTEEDGCINIYVVDEEENKVLRERSNISCEYLPETDRIALKNGLMVYGEEELNKILEDYES